MLKRFVLLALISVSTMAITSSAQFADSESVKVPAYHAAPPAASQKLPPLLKPDQLFGENAQYPYQTHAYELAPKVSKALYQQPCYCYCDRTGHKSLHSCFEGTHGAECATCLKELYYTYQQSQKGKTGAQIRAGIMHGDWKQINLETAAYIR